jgi:hypothetical protein
MINCKKTDFGFRDTFSSPLSLDEVDKWRVQMKYDVLTLSGEFTVFVDSRNCELIPAECKSIVEDVQTFCRENGMRRSAVILSDEMITQQLKIVAKKTGIYESERYINSSSNPDWEQQGMNWIIHGLDPEGSIS